MGERTERSAARKAALPAASRHRRLDAIGTLEHFHGERASPCELPPRMLLLGACAIVSIVGAMYSTCLFCQGSLGTNDVLESFPVGRKLAFDGAKGRLWVICRTCARWNLSPLEERWETLERCERLTRATQPRATTDEIALFRLPEGLQLVRIGSAGFQEVATWRYTARMRWRYWRAHSASMLLEFGLGASVGVMVPLVVIGVPLLAATGPLAGIAGLGVAKGLLGRALKRRTVAFLTTSDGLRSGIRAADLELAAIAPATTSGALSLVVPSEYGASRVEGAEALRLAALALARANGIGAPSLDVHIAVSFVAEVGSGEAYLASAVDADTMPLLGHLPAGKRLALKVAVNDAAERRALDGELSSLERAWREADEIAAIADDLLLPAAVVDRLVRLRGAARRMA